LVRILPLKKTLVVMHAQVHMHGLKKSTVLLFEQILVLMLMLMRIMHPLPAVAGFAVTCILMPLTMIAGRMLSKSRKQMVKFTDSRVKLCSEVLSGKRW
jgi:hypothetical protein